MTGAGFEANSGSSASAAFPFLIPSFTGLLQALRAGVTADNIDLIVRMGPTVFDTTLHARAAEV